MVYDLELAMLPVPLPLARTEPQVTAQLPGGTLGLSPSMGKSHLTLVPTPGPWLFLCRSLTKSGPLCTTLPRGELLVPIRLTATQALQNPV